VRSTQLEVHVELYSCTAVMDFAIDWVRFLEFVYCRNFDFIC